MSDREQQERRLQNESDSEESTVAAAAAAESNDDDGDPVPAWLMSALTRPLPPTAPPPPPPPRETLSDRVVYLSKHYSKAKLEVLNDQHAQRCQLEEQFAEGFEAIEDEEDEALHMLSTLAAQLRMHDQVASMHDGSAGNNDELIAPLIVVDKDGGEENDDDENQHRHISAVAYHVTISDEEQQRMEAFQKSRLAAAVTVSEDESPAAKRNKSFDETLFGPLGSAATRSSSSASSALLLSPRELAEVRRRREERKLAAAAQEEEEATSPPSLLYRDRLCRPTSETGVSPVPSRTLTDWVSTRSRYSAPIVSPDTSPVFYQARRDSERAAMRQEMQAAAMSAKRVQARMAEMQRGEAVVAMMNEASADGTLDLVRKEQQKQQGGKNAALDTHRVAKRVPPKFAAPEPDGFVVDDSTLPVLPLPSVYREQELMMRQC